MFVIIAKSVGSTSSLNSNGQTLKAWELEQNRAVRFQVAHAPNVMR